jgi:hypothetical protein
VAWSPNIADPVGLPPSIPQHCTAISVTYDGEFAFSTHLLSSAAPHCDRHCCAGSCFYLLPMPTGTNPTIAAAAHIGTLRVSHSLYSQHDTNAMDKYIKYISADEHESFRCYRLIAYRFFHSLAPPADQAASRRAKITDAVVG